MNHFFGLIPWFIDGMPAQYVLNALEQSASSPDLKQGFPIIYNLKLNSPPQSGLRDEIAVRVNEHVCDHLGRAHGEPNRLVKPGKDLNRAVVRYALSHAKGLDSIAKLDMMIANEKTPPLFAPETTSELQDKVSGLFLLLFDHLAGVAISVYELTLWFDTDQRVLGEIVHGLLSTERLNETSMRDRVEWADGVHTPHYNVNPAKLNELRQSTASQSYVFDLAKNPFFKLVRVECESRGSFAFVIMPFKPEEIDQAIYTELIKPTASEALKCQCVRNDEDRLGFQLDDKFFSHIVKSKLVIAELSSANVNVIYEMGIAHAFGKTVIPLVKEGSLGSKLPFDYDKFPVLFWQDEPDLRQKLAAILSAHR